MAPIVGYSVVMPRVLLIEDDHDLRGLFRTALVLARHDVLEARNGLEALQCLDRDRPDLVLLDLGLPLVDGYVVRQEIAAHAHTRDIPIVVVTAAQVTPQELDVVCVLRKPVEPDDLVETVRRCLNRAGESARR